MQQKNYGTAELPKDNKHHKRTLPKDSNYQKELYQRTATTRKELYQRTATTRKEIYQRTATTRKELYQRTATTRKGSNPQARSQKSATQMRNNWGIFILLRLCSRFRGVWSERLDPPARDREMVILCMSDRS